MNLSLQLETCSLLEFALPGHTLDKVPTEELQKSCLCQILFSVLNCSAYSSSTQLLESMVQVRTCLQVHMQVKVSHYYNQIMTVVFDNKNTVLIDVFFTITCHIVFIYRKIYLTYAWIFFNYSNLQIIIGGEFKTISVSYINTSVHLFMSGAIKTNCIIIFGRNLH